MYLYEMSSSDFTCYVPLSGLRCLSDLCLTHDSQSAGDITITLQITMMTRELFAGSQIDDCWGVSLFPPLFIPPMNTQRQMLKHQHNHEDIDDEKRLSNYYVSQIMTASLFVFSFSNSTAHLCSHWLMIVVYPNMPDDDDNDDE